MCSLRNLKRCQDVLTCVMTVKLIQIGLTTGGYNI